MKFLNWLKDNVNTVSFIVGIGLIASGKAELGQVVLQQGAQL